MADYYTEFSEEILLDQRTEEFRTAALRWWEKIRSLDTELDCASDDTIQATLVELGVEPREDILAAIREGSYPGFDIKIEERDESVWLSSTDGSANLEILITLVSAYIQQFARYSVFTLTWSDRCSKPRIREFGGGAMAISANGALTLSTSSMCMELVQRLADSAAETRKEKEPS